MIKITSSKDCVPGALYCTFLINDEEGQSDRDGALLYWTGGQFVTEDGDDADHVDWDYLIRQAGDINPSMIEQAT